MRILISTDTYYPHVNGASYFTQRLAYQLKERGHEILIVAPGDHLFSGYTKKNALTVFGVRSIPVFLYNNFRLVLPIGLEKTIEKIILDFKPDIIHVQGHFTVSKQVIVSAKKNNIPVMGTNHFMPENLTHYLHLPRYLDEKLKAWAWRDFRKVFEKLQIVTTPTRAAAGLIKKFGFAKEVHPVSCGIDLVRFNPVKRDETIKKKYNLPDLPLLLYVGRIDREKNLDLVLKAVSQVPQNIKFHFVIGGKGAEKKKLEALTERLGTQKRVTFLGFLPDEDLPKLEASCDCFVNAGTAELQCIAAMEAMASGLPVIAVDAVALPELVHDEKNGYLFPPGDSKKLAECIIKMFSDEQLRSKMARKSLEIIEPHEIAKTIDQFELFYKKLLNEKI